MSIWVLGTQGRHRRSALWGLYSWCQTSLAMTFPSACCYPPTPAPPSAPLPPCRLLLSLSSPWGMRWAQGLQIMTHTSGSVTSRLGSVCDSPAAPVSTSPHHSQVWAVQWRASLPPLSSLSPPQPQRGRRVGGGQRRQWWKCHWRQEGRVLEEMEERSSPWLAWQPGCRAVCFISFQTDICNFPQASGTVEAGGLQGFLSLVVRIQNRASKDYKQSQLPNSLWFVKSLNSVWMMSGVLSFHAMHLLHNISTIYHPFYDYLVIKLILLQRYTVSPPVTTLCD